MTSCVFVCIKPFGFPLVLVKYLCLNSLSTLPVLSWLSENGIVFTETFQVFTCVWFFWAPFVESKNISLFCLCMDLLLSVQPQNWQWVGSVAPCWNFFVRIGKTVQVVVKPGVLQPNFTPPWILHLFAMFQEVQALSACPFPFQEIQDPPRAVWIPLQFYWSPSLPLLCCFWRSFDSSKASWPVLDIYTTIYINIKYYILYNIFYNII